MTTLHIGVVEIPEPESSLTTYEVAELLEHNYELFSKFAESHADQITEALTASVQGAIGNLMNGVETNPYAEGTSDIDQMFRTFLDTEQMAQLGVRGVPTKAALMGVSKRFKKRRGERRPSFIDSGILQASLKSWVD